MRALRDQNWWRAVAVSVVIALGQGCAAQDTRTDGEPAGEPTPANSASAEQAAIAEIPRIAPADLLSALEGESGPVVLDVRTPEEYTAGHIEGAINIPHDQIESHLASLDVYRDRDIVVYCRSGRRAEIAERVLRDAGFEGVKDLEGHMVHWTAHELPLTATCC